MLIKLNLLLWEVPLCPCQMTIEIILYEIYMMHYLAIQAVILMKRSNILNVVTQNVLASLLKLDLIIVLRGIFQICYVMGMPAFDIILETHK